MNNQIVWTCSRGHELTENLVKRRKDGSGGRECRVCIRNRQRRVDEARKAQGLTHTARTHCPRNHPYSPENTYRDKRNRRRCITCRDWSRANQAGGKRGYVPDGWEDEFGMYPPRVSNRVWVDRVVLARTLASEDPGRALTSGEIRALHLLSVMRQGQAEGWESGIRTTSERHGNTFRVKGVKIA